MSAKNLLYKYLQENPQWFWGGQLEDYGRGFGYKASNIARRLRDLVSENKIEREEKQVNGNGQYCVKYRILVSDTLF